MSTTNTNTCPYCTANLPPESSVCPKCGSWINENASAPEIVAARVAHWWERPQENAHLWIIGLAAGIFILILMLCGSLALLWQQQQPLSFGNNTSLRTQTWIATVRTATAQSAATQQVFKSQQTAEAGARAAAQTATADVNLRNLTASWATLYSEDFSIDNGHWYLDESEDDLVKGVWRLADGQYQVDLTAVDGFSQWMWPEADDLVVDTTALNDFRLSAEMRFDSGPADAQAGLIFQLQNENSSFYLYSITAEGKAEIYYHSPSNWETLLTVEVPQYLRTSEVNLLEVIYSERQYHLYLNGNRVASFQDNRLTNGWVGVMVGLNNAEDRGVWLIDNFLLQTP